MTVNVVLRRPRKEGRVVRLPSQERDRAGPVAMLELPADRGSDVMDIAEWILRKAEGCRVKICLDVYRDCEGDEGDRAHYEREVGYY